MNTPQPITWRYSETPDGEIATFEGAGLSACVRMCGGYSVWSVRSGRTIVAEGEDHGLDPCHFLMCLRAAESALVRELSRRRRDIPVLRRELRAARRG